MPKDIRNGRGEINIAPYDDQSQMYLLFNLINKINEIRSNAKDTPCPEINEGRFCEMDIIFPSKTLMASFGEIAYDVIRQVRCLMQANIKSAKARDLLLPKLMSGEVVI